MQLFDYLWVYNVQVHWSIVQIQLPSYYTQSSVQSLNVILIQDSLISNHCMGGTQQIIAWGAHSTVHFHHIHRCYIKYFLFAPFRTLWAVIADSNNHWWLFPGTCHHSDISVLFQRKSCRHTAPSRRRQHSETVETAIMSSRAISYNTLNLAYLQKGLLFTFMIPSSKKLAITMARATCLSVVY